MSERSWFKIAMGTLILGVLLALFFAVESGFATNRDWFVEAGSVDIDSIQWVLVTNYARVDSHVVTSAEMPWDSIFALDDTKTHQIIKRLWYTGYAKPIIDVVEVPALAVAGAASISQADKDDIVDSVAQAMIDDRDGTGPLACTVLVKVGDDSISQVAVRIQDSSGTPVSPRFITNTNGYNAYGVDTGAYWFTAAKGGYAFPPVFDTVSVGQTVTITGTSHTVSPPDDPNTCRVVGWTAFLTGAASPRSRISVELMGRAIDTCADRIIVPVSMPVIGPDADGEFYIDCIWSACYVPHTGSEQDSIKYAFKVDNKIVAEVWVPSDTLYYLDW